MPNNRFPAHGALAKIYFSHNEGDYIIRDLTATLPPLACQQSGLKLFSFETQNGISQTMLTETGAIRIARCMCFRKQSEPLRF
jgi:hypothetical protein